MGQGFKTPYQLGPVVDAQLDSARVGQLSVQQRGQKQIPQALGPGAIADNHTRQVEGLLELPPGPAPLVGYVRAGQLLGHDTFMTLGDRGLKVLHSLAVDASAQADEGKIGKASVQKGKAFLKRTICQAAAAVIKQVEDYIVNGFGQKWRHSWATSMPVHESMEIRLPITNDHQLAVQDSPAWQLSQDSQLGI